jgi:hypothetical protein
MSQQNDRFACFEGAPVHQETSFTGSRNRQNNRGSKAFCNPHLPPPVTNDRFASLKPTVVVANQQQSSGVANDRFGSLHSFTTAAATTQNAAATANDRFDAMKPKPASDDSDTSPPMQANDRFAAMGDSKVSLTKISRGDADNIHQPTQLGLDKYGFNHRHYEGYVCKEIIPKNLEYGRHKARLIEIAKEPSEVYDNQTRSLPEITSIIDQEILKAEEQRQVDAQKERDRYLRGKLRENKIPSSHLPKFKELLSNLRMGEAMSALRNTISKEVRTVAKEQKKKEKENNEEFIGRCYEDAMGCMTGVGSSNE